MISEGRSGSFYDYTSISPQNVEKQFDTDHLRHFLLSNFIIPRILLLHTELTGLAEAYDGMEIALS
jgi:hypothetical protein